MTEIDTLKQSILSEQTQITQIQIENPSVEEMVNFHGYSQALTVEQCNDLEEEN